MAPSAALLAALLAALAAAGPAERRAAVAEVSEESGACLLQRAVATAAVRWPQRTQPPVQQQGDELFGGGGRAQAALLHVEARQGLSAAAEYAVTALQSRNEALAELAAARRGAEAAEREVSRLRAHDGEMRRQNDRLQELLRNATEGVAAASTAAPEEEESEKMSPARRWSYYLTAIFLALSCCGLGGWKLILIWHWREMLDADDDGDVDMDDLRELCFGFSLKGIANLFMVFLIAAAGFAALWHAQMIQKYVSQFSDVALLLLLLLVMVQIVVQDAYAQLKRHFKTMLKRIDFVHSGLLNADAGSEKAKAAPAS